jgi:hypothetical protein
MSFQAQCPQCLFVSRQLGQPIPCLLHVTLAASAELPQAAPEPAAECDYDEPYVFGELRPTVDRPGPFSVREYVRLRLLRYRVQEERAVDVMGALSTAAQEQSVLSR